jgi:nicotinamide-nucleotide amidase
MLLSSIFSIGKEIISGFINDTNSFYVASELTTIGIQNRFTVSIDDDEYDICDSLNYYLRRVDIIITTGGLGPTFDDITLSSVAKALNKKLIFSENSYRHIEKFYSNLYKNGKIESAEMNDKRKKMAYIPEGSVELRNKTGAASGIYIQENNKHIFCLPGIPKEMKPMLEESVLPILKNLSHDCIVNKTYEFQINDETVIGEYIDRLKSPTLHIKSLPTGFDSKTIGVRFTAYGKNKDECLLSINSAKNKLSKAIESNA